MKLLYTDETGSNFTVPFFDTITNAVIDKLDIDALDECEVSLLLTDDTTIRELNKNYRNKDKATDVLSFPMEEDNMLGDIAISIDTAKRQAEDAEIPLEREIGFLYIHGLLHLFGYDHERSLEEEVEMFELQEEILRSLIDSGLIN